MKHTHAIVVSVLTIAFLPEVADAELLKFEFSGYQPFSFYLDSSPTPSGHFDNGFTTFAFDKSSNGHQVSKISASSFNVTFNSYGGLGSFGSSGFQAYNGVKIYSGTEQNPIFSPGIFHLTSDGDGSDGTLNVALSTVPLPASAPLFGAALIGLTGIGYAAKRKKAAAVA